MSGYPLGAAKSDTKMTKTSLVKSKDQQLAGVQHQEGDAVATNPVIEHQQHSLHFDTIVAFMKRSQHFYKALEEMMQYLPNEGERANEALFLVTQQRTWMFDVGCAVGRVVGTFYQLEKNTLSELIIMNRLGQENMSIKMMKKNFRATAANLETLAEFRKDAEVSIQECESSANQMVKWHGQEEKLQHAAMTVIGKFGGSQQSLALIEKLEKGNEKVDRAQQDMVTAASKLSEVREERERVQCQHLVYDSIAANEKGSLQRLQERAKELDKAAAERSEESAKTFNIEHKRKTFFWRTWETDWVDNQGDVARWRAERFKSAAKEAADAKTDQQAHTADAVSKAAELAGKFIGLGTRMEMAEKEYLAAAQKVEDAKQELMMVKKEAAKLQEEFGGLELHQIASLREHMQKLPQMLGAQGMNDNSMFASMNGALKQHQMLCDKMKIFLDEDDDKECRNLLNNLKPLISKAIEDSHFFSEKMANVKAQVDDSIKTIKDVSTSEPPGMLASEPPPCAASEVSSDDEPVNLREESADEMW